MYFFICLLLLFWLILLKQQRSRVKSKVGTHLERVEPSASELDQILPPVSIPIN